MSKVGNKKKYLNKSQGIDSLMRTGHRTTLGIGPILHLVGDSSFVQHCNACRLLARGLPRTLLSLPSSCSARICLLLCQIVMDSGDLSLALYTCMTIPVLTVQPLYFIDTIVSLLTHLSLACVFCEKILLVIYFQT